MCAYSHIVAAGNDDDVQAISAMALDTNERTRLKTAGLTLVREKHSMAAREQIFLSKFRV